MRHDRYMGPELTQCLVLPAASLYAAADHFANAAAALQKTSRGRARCRAVDGPACWDYWTAGGLEWERRHDKASHRTFPGRGNTVTAATNATRRTRTAGDAGTAACAFSPRTSSGLEPRCRTYFLTLAEETAIGILRRSYFDTHRTCSTCSAVDRRSRRTSSPRAQCALPEGCDDRGSVVRPRATCARYRSGRVGVGSDGGCTEGSARLRCATSFGDEDPVIMISIQLAVELSQQHADSVIVGFSVVRFG